MKAIEGLPASVQELAMTFAQKEQELLKKFPDGRVGAPYVFVPLRLIKELMNECLVNDDGAPYQSKVHLSPNSPEYNKWS